VDLSGRGVISVLAADRLVNKPRMYATFLLWLLSELFEQLPEVGDPEKPRLVFFFDEAHLLFDNAPRALVEKVEQVVRLIRSKGVGVFFVTQNPLDVPETVLGQLGNRMQHAMRAFTPHEQKAIRVAAQTFRSNPNLDVEQAFMQMGVGEALISTLQEKGVPAMVDRTLIRPPTSRIGPITEQERSAVRSRSPVGSRYDQTLDRESAEEVLRERAEKSARAAAEEEGRQPAQSRAGAAPRRSNRQSPTEAAVKSFLRSMSTTLGREIMRGILGVIKKR
jgi:DNA helicase HerA-like ATPase